MKNFDMSNINPFTNTVTTLANAIEDLESLGEGEPLLLLKQFIEAVGVGHLDDVTRVELTYRKTTRNSHGQGYRIYLKSSNPPKEQMLFGVYLNTKYPAYIVYAAEAAALTASDRERWISLLMDTSGAISRELEILKGQKQT